VSDLVMRLRAEIDDANEALDRLLDEAVDRISHLELAARRAFADKRGARPGGQHRGACVARFTATRARSAPRLAVHGLSAEFLADKPRRKHPGGHNTLCSSMPARFGLFCENV
jgi:hypothetical protein